MFNLLIFLAFLCREQPPPRGCVLKLNKFKITPFDHPQPPPRGCVLKLVFPREWAMEGGRQPPPRGCVLKLVVENGFSSFILQPPPRGCVLKLFGYWLKSQAWLQPPPRGCVLKHHYTEEGGRNLIAAASARLCVETHSKPI